MQCRKGLPLETRVLRYRHWGHGDRLPQCHASCNARAPRPPVLRSVTQGAGRGIEERCGGFCGYASGTFLTCKSIPKGRYVSQQ